ncbi:MAG: glycogen/starch/alpha-glucan phosphorylase, partial [Oscillospiraceae bacterium]|nr:glycogen/starch/alpha-glucan phosphorylase [Oscillospiraceae bacterium]
MIKDERIDRGTPFDWGRTSQDYAKYRDIYPQQFYEKIAALGLCGDGAGICYHEGLFHQRFRDHKQVEEKDPWITKESWLRDTGVRFPVTLGELHTEAVMYD